MEMPGRAASLVEMEALKAVLPDIIASATSLEAIETWLTSQPGVARVRRADGALKSNPPQRCLIVDLRVRAEFATMEVYIDELAIDRFGLNSFGER
jgi:hypothetical protein